MSDTKAKYWELKASITGYGADCAGHGKSGGRDCTLEGALASAIAFALEGLLEVRVWLINECLATRYKDYPRYSTLDDALEVVNDQIEAVKKLGGEP